MTIDHLLQNISAGLTIKKYCEKYEADEKLIRKALKEVAEKVDEWASIHRWALFRTLPY